jgi:hypothetical protein
MSVNIFGSSGTFSHGVDTRYVDQKFTTLSTNLTSKVNKAGDTISGNLNILINDDGLRTFGVSDINTGKSMSLLLGNTDNQIRHNFGHALKLSAVYGIKFTCPAGETCRMGAHNDARAKFLKDIMMNDNAITGLRNPTDDKDAATKQYIDTRCVKNSVGYIPNLEANNSITGFSASSSDVIGPGFQPYGAFNNTKADASNGSWATNNSTGWLKIQCPDPVRIWRIALKARPIAGRNITSWCLSGSIDGRLFTVLFTSTTALLGAATTPSFFEINTIAYQYYLINILTSEGTPGVGIHAMQLYTVDTLI